MLDTIRIDRVTGTEDDGKGGITITLQDPPVYEGRGYVQSYRPYETDRDVATVATIIQQRYDIGIPVGVGPVHVGDYVTVTASTENPLLVGNVYRIAGPHEKTSQTSQRMLADHAPAGIQYEEAGS